MTKRLIGIFLFLCLLFSLTGCAGLHQPEPTEPLPEKAWVFFSYGRCRITNAEGQKIVFGIDDEQTDMEFLTRKLQRIPLSYGGKKFLTALFLPLKRLAQAANMHTNFIYPQIITGQAQADMV